VSTPDVFIIESLDPDDEGNGRCEGTSISHVLRLHDKHPQYCYVRTRKQFAEAINEFRLSNYRYLHISAHGDRDGMATTNLDEIGNAQLAELLSPALSGKRLFLSACKMVHRQLAREIIPRTGCQSVVGPRQNIGFAEAAVFWPAVYHLMFTRDSSKITRTALRECLSKVATLFEVEIGFYSRAGTTLGYSRDILKAGV
jgi:hypothetical protein